jgi:tagatose-6-phosphate ketose/aldose isomerase
LEIWRGNRDSVKKFIERFSSPNLRIIFTGAGTSQYVGDVLASYLTQRWTESGLNGQNNGCQINEFVSSGSEISESGTSESGTSHSAENGTEVNGFSKITFQSIASTDIVATPTQYLRPFAVSGEKTILVSFARSGNSPESIAAVKIADQILKNDVAHIFVTCAEDGELAKMAQRNTTCAVGGEGDGSENYQQTVGQVGGESDGCGSNRFLFLTPTLSNDLGFAMTSSFTCMMLAGALIFDTGSPQEFAKWVDQIATAGESVIERETEIQTIVDTDFDRIVYLGSGSFAGLAREAQLKILELTAGQIATVYDTSMGFRHGPKSFINSRTLVFGFVSPDRYTRRYDLDVLEEIAADGIAPVVYAIGNADPPTFPGANFSFDNLSVPELYLALPDIMFAQTLAVMASLKVKNTPDTPSKSGTVNRVVKGVKIYDYNG